ERDNGNVHGDVTIPLLEEGKNIGDEENVYTDEEISGKASLWMVYLSTFVAVCGSFAFGSCAGYSSPTQTAITKDLSLTLAEYSVFGSILTFGAMIGATTSGPIADFIGRKGAMRTATGFSVAGWLAIYFAKGALSLDIGRLATGYGMGVFSYVVPVFIAEIAPKNLRGALRTVNQMTQVELIRGVIAGLIPCAILLFGLFFIPESPRWLAKIGHEKEFEAALQDLRGKGADISEEAAENRDYIETLERLPKAKMLDLFQRRYFRSSLSWFNGVSTIRGNQWNLLLSQQYFRVPITALNTTVIDKAGRKPLLLVSSTGLVLACILSGTSFYLKDHNLAPSSVPILAVTGILSMAHRFLLDQMYIGSFSAEMGAVPWVVMSKIFPINIKGIAGSLATLVNWFGTFIIYAAINAVAIVFVITVVPETKGKTLEQIQAAINA
ncbi:hypothetical protein Goshw_003497, partial [Gossypium schwendimanii]|nr:hypothetical protein [Gossypium schwendimanii]